MTDQRTQFYQVMRQVGAYSAKDIRDKEDLPPVELHILGEIYQCEDGRFAVAGDNEFRTDDWELAQYISDELFTGQRGALERTPGVNNWIERLPAAMREAWDKSIVYRAAVHMVNEHGMAIGHAIASALNWASFICHTGDVKQWPGPQAVRPTSVAECCAAGALWKSMIAASHAQSAANKK